MTPIPQEYSSSQDILTESVQQYGGNDVVISGMSGLYPQAYHIKELSDILYNKINPVTQNDFRFDYNYPEMVQYAGTIPDINYFDAQFFKVHYHLAFQMDPMAKKLLEQTYQAIYDAGVNPDQLSGKKVGVYVGLCLSESEKGCFYNADTSRGYALIGCSRTMFANRISYWLNAKGPSLAIDEACCSSTAALEQAYSALIRGECEAAVVAASNLSLHPQTLVHYGRTIKLCCDGKTKSFDENADGCAKTEAINVLFLQKAKDALRIYAKVIHVKSEYTSMITEETGPKHGYYRNVSGTTNFIKKFYEEAKVPPQAVEYVEAYGSATPEADKAELQAIEEIFCKDRDYPLLVGSVMSNIGYTDAASGTSAITKVLLGYHKGKLAANLHCEKPRQDITALREGRMRIVTEHEGFQREFVAINGMSYTGINSHILLHGSYKTKDLNRYKSNIPHLVTLSGRHEEAVKHALEILRSCPIDPEQLALLHNIHRMSISGHLGRGFIILQKNKENETVSLREVVEYFDGAKRPLWFVYSGMGSQWTGMGSALMRIPIFAAAIERCDKALASKGLNIKTIITSNDNKIFDNILHTFVGIAAIQIGLTDILLTLGLKPDGIIGHSVGELGCAYADGCLTTEEMILAAYYRGLVSLETKFIQGSMAAIGMGFEEISKICPPEIEVACHNGSASCTISGPSESMRKFIALLTAKGIFAKEVPCSNIAYHSRYIAEAGPGLLKYLKHAINSPKARSERWLSTSLPKDRWDEPIAKLCSAEYFTNNLLSPVLFEETSQLIPNNAVIVEIAPHGLLQAILKRSMPASCVNISLTKRNHSDSILFFLESIGQLFMEGYNFDISALYPKVELPVSTGTPFLSHMIKWMHDEKWPLTLHSCANRRFAAHCNVSVALQDKEYNYLEGHSIRGKTLFPFTASLILVWDILAMIMDVPKKQLSVEFTDVKVYAQPILHDKRQLKLSMTIQRGTGRFEVLDGSSKVVTGFILTSKFITNSSQSKEWENLYFSAEDLYQLLRDRDYFYSGEFQSIKGADESLSNALLIWQDNWVTFIDGMLQLVVLRQPHSAVSLPTHIRSIQIDVKEHNNCLDNSKETVLMKAEVNKELDCTRCGGVSIKNIKFRNLPPVNERKLTLRALNFVPYFQTRLTKSGKLKNREGNARELNFNVMDQDNWDSENYLPLSMEGTVNKNITLQSVRFGDVDSMNWVDAPKLIGCGVTVTVHYAGINNNDIKRANSSLYLKQNIEHGYGSDFSGITETGERVMGIVSTGAVSSQVMANSELLWPVPAHWSLEEAATVPLAYAQALYCLGIKAEFRHGMTVLVHGGSGALGQAVISVALAHDCEVFTTVSDVRKKEFLLKRFPTLKAEHIASSRDPTFSDMVLTATKAEGCDIIISCVKGYLKNVTLKCTGLQGTCYDVSHIQNQDDFDFGMRHLFVLKNYSTVDFSRIFSADNVDEAKMINKMLTEGIKRGYVRPLTCVTFEPLEVARAFRLLATSHHRGRVLLRMKDNTLQAQSRLIYREDGSHLLICNSATFGIRLADMFVTKGVKKICLHVPEQSPYVLHKVRLWQKLGVDVVIFTGELNKQNISVILNDCSKLGPLEGIYVTADDKNDTVAENVIRYLDSEVRKLCPGLRYFAVFNIGGGKIGEAVCHQRICDQLPGTMLSLPDLKSESYNDCTIWRSAVDVAEQALQKNRGMSVACAEIRPRLSLLQELSTLAGVSLPNDIDNSLSLRELGIQNHKLPLISDFLQVQYNVSFDEEQVQQLTIDTILDLEKAIQKFPYDEINGFETFFSYIDRDEILATADMVTLPTLVHSSAMRDDEFVADEQFLCIIPGVEGHHERFRALCERLKLPALVLQPGLDKPNETVREMAERFVKVLLKKTQMKDTFHLLGYESGVFVALEVAAILEQRGLSGTVYCLGCAPDELKYEIDQQLAGLDTEDELQQALLRHMYTLIADNDTAQLDDALQNINTWSQKVETCVRILLGHVSHSAQYARLLIECAFARIQQARNNTAVVRPLRSKIVLLRAAQHVPQHDTLQQHSLQPLVVYQLSTRLAHVVTDLHCAAIINENLDPTVLEHFETRNICITYLLNGDTFIDPSA